MTFEALATDYDGTLAHDSVVDDVTVAALNRARTAGLRLIMVTGREVRDLMNVFAQAALFDRIVGENGGVLYDPATQTLDVLGAAPPAPLIEWLTNERVPFSVGHSILATAKPYEHQVLAAIRDLELEWHVI